jgi:2-polyprenyl-3-methyl-5-hydroxy-6-metoxy-1,4-benzoquinol methylase
VKVDDITDIQEMYNANWEREDDRLLRHQLEHDITWRYLEKYLAAPGANILEIGPATGRYTMELARRGYNVLAIDIAAELVTRAKARIDDLGLGSRVEFRVGDIRTCGDMPESSFDAALVMGPLYHLVLQEDRELVLNRVFKFLKPGGVVFSAWISRFGIFGDNMKKMPDLIFKKEAVSSILENGCDRNRFHPKGNFRGYYARADEIGPIHEQSGFRTLAVAGAEPAISADDDSYNCLEGERRQLWLDLLFKLSAEPSMAASSRHMLYVGEKPEKGGK